MKMSETKPMFNPRVHNIKSIHETLQKRQIYHISIVTFFKKHALEKNGSNISHFDDQT